MAGEILKRSALLAACLLLILGSSWVGGATFGDEPRLSVCSSSASVTITGNVVSEMPPFKPAKNPAATFCVNEGFTHEIRIDPVTGARAGYCVFPDESGCEEWAFFRGTCSYTPPTPAVAGTLDLAGSGGDEEDGGPGEGSVEAEAAATAASAAVKRIEEEIAPLLAKELDGTLTPEEAANLSEKRLELLEAEVDLIEAEMAVLAAERDLSELKDESLALKEEALALTLEKKEIERRGLLGLVEEGDDARHTEIDILLLIVDLRLEALEIEGRALAGTSWPEDEERLRELNEAIDYLEAEMEGGGGDEV
jgi:putative hemolysin